MNKRTIFKTAAVLLTLALVSGLAYAVTIRGGDDRYESSDQMMGGERMHDRQPMRDREMMRPRRGMPEHALTRVQGNIIGMKTVKIKGKDVKHQVLRVRSDLDNIVLIDLGPRTQKIRNLNLSEGKRVNIVGLGGVAEGQKLILADRIQVDGQTVHVKTPKMKRVEGRVVAAQDVSIRKTGDKNRVVILQTPQGKLPIDLGPRAKLLDINIREGTSMKAEGKLVRVQGKPFLMASMFKAGENPPRAVKRPAGQKK